MIHCWVCKTEVDESNSSGSVKGRLKNECVRCHAIYCLIAKFKNLTDEELYVRINRALRIEDLCELVKDNRDKSIAELTKSYVEGL